MVAPPSPARRAPRWRHITIGLTPDLHGRLRRLAEREERLVEQQAAYLLRLAVERAEFATREEATDVLAR